MEKDSCFNAILMNLSQIGERLQKIKNLATKEEIL